MLVAITLAPLGSSEADVPVETLTQPASAGLLEQELLTLLGWEGRIGIDGAALDEAAARGLPQIGAPTQAVRNAEDALARLRSASGLSGAFAAAAHVTGVSVSPEAPAADDPAAAIAEFYVRLGAPVTAADLLELRLATAALDPGTATGLAQVVAAMNDAIEAHATGDVNAMMQGSADVLAAIESAVPLMQSSASSSCHTFEDPLHFIIVAGPCDDLHDVDRYLSIDLGGNDVYTNNAGGADVTNPFAYVNPAHDIGTMGTMPGVLVRSLMTLDTTEADSLVADLTDVNDPNYANERYQDDYYARINQIRAENAEIVSFPAILGQAIADCLAVCGVDPRFDPVAVHDHGPIGVAVDLGGDDTYTAANEAAQGGARNAIGILADLGTGADKYTATNLAQGAAERGVGILYDEGGDDEYSAERDAQGAFDGGFLLDMDGDDKYTGGVGVQGGRTVPFVTVTATSILFDAHGDDTYFATGFAQGAGNILVDAEGKDSYTAVGPSPANNDGGAAQGVGFLDAHGVLLDGAGDDTYSSTGEGGQAFALEGYASGSLIDLSGNDSYWSSEAGQGACSVDIPFGALLYDGGGDDTYTVGTFGQGASRSICSAYLVDRTGNDIYTAVEKSQGATNFDGTETTGGTTGVGILADGGGDDTYTSGDWSQGASHGTGLGMLFDADGVDTYTAGDNSQGAGGLGTGILVDGLQDAVHSDSDAMATVSEISFEVNAVLPGDVGGGDVYTAGDYSQGSSGPLGWIGILVDNDDESAKGGGPHVNHYTAGDYSQGSAVAAGVGVFVDREGRDVYTVPDETRSRGYGEGGYLSASPALFLDLNNKHDEYSGFTPPTDGNDRVENKGSGFEIDIDGTPSEDWITSLPDEIVELLTTLTVLAPNPSPNCAGAYFCDDVEGAPQFTATMGLNEWRIIDQTVTPQPPGQPNAHSGNQYWYVGAAGAPGITYVGNDDGSVVAARTTLTSDAFDLSASTAPKLSFRLAGQTESGFDFVNVALVDTAGNVHALDGISGRQSYNGVNEYALTGLGLTLTAETAVKIRFTFATDLVVEEGGGFNLDDVIVSE